MYESPADRQQREGREYAERQTRMEMAEEERLIREEQDRLEREEEHMSNPLTVGELLAALHGVPPDTLVVLQKDAEGNGYSPASGVQVENAVYEADSTWSGEVKYARLTDELRQQGYGEDDTGGPDAVPCVCLWPVN